MTVALVTESQLSILLNIPARTLQTQRQTGRGIPFVKIGKSVRYDINTVHQYLESNQYNSTSRYELPIPDLIDNQSIEKIIPD